MKALLVLALVSAASAGATLQDICLIPNKYATATGGACTGPVAGYTVTGFCQSYFAPDATNLATAPTVSATLATTNRGVFTSGVTTLANSGCNVPTSGLAWTTANFVTALDANAGNCYAQPAVATATGAAALTGLKGATVVCDAANDYYASAGVEGSMYCMGGGTAATNAGANVAAAASAGFFSGNVGTQVSATTTPTWDSDALTCSRGCVVPSPYCTGANLRHANLLAWGTNLFAGATTNCLMRPTSTATFVCKTNPARSYTATCTANAADNTAAGTLTWDTTPNCGTTDGAMTGFYINNQVEGLSTQTAGELPAYSSATSTLAKVETIAANAAYGGQIGGYGRALEPFRAASTYQVAVAGCPTEAAGNAECVQQVVNWWRCQGLTIDSATICYYAASNQIACPTHTNGYRCPSSSKKGLLGLLGLIGIVPLLLLSLLCCLLLPCLCKRKKTEDDVHIATFDPHAAPVAGSIAPGTACYAPSVGGVPTAVY